MLIDLTSILGLIANFITSFEVIVIVAILVYAVIEGTLDAERDRQNKEKRDKEKKNKK